ncbi:secreted salivary gland peptide, putative [Ixodes scapularis]|uniref:Putative secreted salivary protein n=1 Tax=Ixodes scapularis TaxID=6945 RepID=Q4PN53_IXOSC|nr:putative secreted salivary protein [Ixodes scapularis]EEC10939.1 secreted salivary gland peptide, putative [Ixodes scapularis]|eukprot:XP_002409806.1 secreted salivary gland peptide, putative [Ixodes scapularis]
MAQKLTLMVFVVFALLAIPAIDYVAGSGRDKGNAKRPKCTMTDCKSNDQCQDPPCSRCDSGAWGTGRCAY